MNPTGITYHKASKTLELAYAEGETVTIAAELLRVFSPSAEVRGHSDAERVLQTGKKHVGIDAIEAIGNYAVRIVFDDGHDTGIYSWAFLRELALEQTRYWESYLRELKEKNASRLPAIPVGQWAPAAARPGGR